MTTLQKQKMKILEKKMEAKDARDKGNYEKAVDLEDEIIDREDAMKERE